MEIELADAVAAVRDELLDASARATGADVEFVVGPIELEFGVELKLDVKAKTGSRHGWCPAISRAASLRAARTR